MLGRTGRATQNCYSSSIQTLSVIGAAPCLTTVVLDITRVINTIQRGSPPPGQISRLRIPNISQIDLSTSSTASAFRGVGKSASDFYHGLSTAQDLVSGEMLVLLRRLHSLSFSFEYQPLTREIPMALRMLCEAGLTYCLAKWGSFY